MDFSSFLSSFSTTSMEDLSKGEIVFEFPPFLRVYRDGKAMRLLESEPVSPSDEDPKTGVASKDVLIDPETGVSARIYLPKVTTNDQKLPLLVYFHGGGFCIETAFSPFYHEHLNSLVAEANVVAVSVDYRRAPDYLVPIAHEDSWVALKWVLSHTHGDGSESWINTYVDFDRIFLAGDSAGANIANNMAIRIGNSEDLSGVKEVLGVVLVHPYFGGVKPVGSEENDLLRKEMLDKLWMHICSATITGRDDPLLNPANDPNLSRLGCKRMLIFVAEMDMLRERGWFYYETLKKKKSTEWINGELEIMETEGEDHVFHLFNPAKEKSKDLMKQFVSFLNQEI